VVRVRIEPGICGFSAEVRVFGIRPKSVVFDIKSECKQVMILARQLEKLDRKDILRGPIQENPIYEKAGKSGLHPACPVPCALIKAAEAELGLALTRDIRISFLMETLGVSRERQ
jgi:hypothetical protein